MSYLDYLCIAVCALHFIVSFIQSLLSGKKIERICTKCLHPVLKGEEHNCSDVLTSEQLSKLTEFISSLRGDSDGCSND